MNQFGISGNLGRRDSGRLAEVLNTLRDLGVNGSANLKAFMNSYNTALNNELAEARRNASPATSYTEQLRNLTLNARPSLATAPFIISPRYYENGRPSIYKKGGLISKNPVEQFKTILKGSTLTSLKTGGIIPKYQWGNTLIQSVENRRNQINSIANKAANIVATNIQSTKNRKSLLDKASAKPKKKGVGNYVRDIVSMQKALWDIGAFKGVKDRHGREATLETAVDGIDGNMTLLALANAKKRGYGIDSKTGNIKIIKLKHQPTMEGDHPAVTYTPKNNLFTKTMSMFGNVYDFITGESSDKNNYQNSKRYTSKVDWYKPYSGYDGYKSRLGDLGLVKGKDGTYKLFDKNGKLIDLCAQTTNSLLLMLRKHQNTIGDAWTSHGMYGDSMLINGYKYLPKIGTYNKAAHTLQNMIAAAAVLPRLKNLDLLTGDVVGLYSANSAHNDEAWAQGTLNRSNSHEGIVFRPYPTRKDLTYIIHNITGDISIDPISKFMVSKSGLLLDWAPTYVMRPNKGPKQKLKPVEKPLTYRASFDGKTFYDVLTTEGKKKYGLDIHSGKNYRLINGKPVAV